MVKYVIGKCNGVRVREYLSNASYRTQFATDVNLKEGVFVIFKIYKDSEMYLPYLSLNYKPKKVLFEYGYTLDDFCSYDSICEFIEQIIENTRRYGNRDNVTFYPTFVREFDLEIR